MAWYHDPPPRKILAYAIATVLLVLLGWALESCGLLH